MFPLNKYFSQNYNSKKISTIYNCEYKTKT